MCHLVEAVGQRGEALHMGQSQQAAEEAVEGGLILPLLLELLSQLKQALPPPVQHPQSQPEPALPPIRAPPAEDECTPPRHSTEAPQVERNSPTQNERLKRIQKMSAAHINTDRAVPEERRGGSEHRFHSASYELSKSRTGGKEQAEGAPASHTEKIHSPPLLGLHQERRTEEVGECLLFERQSCGPIPALLMYSSSASACSAHWVSLQSLNREITML